MHLRPLGPTSPRPKAREVLDYYHCAEYVHKVAKLQYGDSLAGRQGPGGTLATYATY